MDWRAIRTRGRAATWRVVGLSGVLTPGLAVLGNGSAFAAIRVCGQNRPSPPVGAPAAIPLAAVWDQMEMSQVTVRQKAGHRAGAEVRQGPQSGASTRPRRRERPSMCEPG
jgi:hypothetical protein